VLTRVFNPDASASPRLRIGEWWADRTTNELGRAGGTVRVEPKAMEVLMVLADHAGQVVSREELLAAVWPGVVVGDEALTQSVIKLRRALGDNPRSPSYIATISKRGYRLIAPVEKAEGIPAMHDDGGRPLPQPSPVQAPRGIRPRAWMAGIVLVLIVAGVYVFGSLLRPLPAMHVDADAFDVGDGETAALLTVAVLPFETLGAGPEKSHLARGISSDLMTDLSRLSGLRLISASGDSPSSQAARTARYVVSGSVQREAATLRINIRLIDSRTNEQLWSQRFERPFGDLFAIQNEISRSLVAQLPGKISDAERQRFAKRYTHSLEAYEHFLRGRALFLIRQTEENRQARAFYAKAIELDPRFARAYAGLAMTYVMDHYYQGSANSSASLVRALDLAETARLIDPDIPEVYWALGFVHTRSRRHDLAIESLQKAIELNRSYADAYGLLGGIYTYTGQPAKAIPLLRTGLRLNSDGGYLYYQNLGRAYLFVNDLEQALINLREALARNPQNVEAHVYLAATLVADGNFSEAEWEADQIRAQDAGFSTRNWLETYPLTSTRHRERLLDLLAKVGL
jgi:DNA-binding winged helix-turn-helix (wHTH) protein/TolB-like protein/Tfp pilus assembly protein PilF